MDKNSAFSNFPTFTYGAVPLAERRAKWFSWKRGFEICLRASKITDSEERKDLLLAKGGFELQEIFFNIPGADVATDIENNIDAYSVAIEKLDGYFAPQRHEAHERYIFWAMKPEPEESLEKFLMRAQMHASKCNFGKSSTESSGIAVIDKLLQFVPSHLREKLLLEVDLTVEKVMQQVSAFETTRSASEQISGQSILQQPVKSSETVSRIPSTCKFCGRSHTPDGSCPAWNKTCSNCGKRGHFRAVCFSRVAVASSSRSADPFPGPSSTKRSFGQAFQRNMGPSTKSNINSQKRRPGRLHAIEDDENDEDIPELIEMVSSASDSDELLCVKVGGVLIEMQIDSGVQSNIIDDQTWSSMLRSGVKTVGSIRQSDRKFKAYAQTDCLNVLAMFDAETSITDGNKKLCTDARFYVVQGGPQPLLGKITAKKLGVLVVGLPSHRSQQEMLHQLDIVRPFPCVQGVKIHIPIDRSVEPVAQRLRRLPFATLD
ncbi:uncharacterized protein LOC134287556 isoform X2 [Aedes albopictus]|uniref:CCHC-type domain-containing protein n=1 Tax=Aedes albopictus TaxID=7160 RepID=A0ABM1YZF8_AEDAL